MVIQTKQLKLNNIFSLLKIVSLMVLIVCFSCQSDSEDLPEDDMVNQEDEEDNTNDDTDGDNNPNQSIDFPFDIGLANWKITLPRNFSGNTRDGVLVADEVYLDASRNDYSSDPSFRVYDDEYFFLTEENYARFECPATEDIPTTSVNTTNTRTELREMPSDGSGEAGWDATNSVLKTMELRVRVIQTPNSKKFAFAQIHDFQQPIWDDLIRIQIQSDESNATVGDRGRIFVMGDMVEGELEDGFDVDFRALNYDDRVIKDDYVLGDWLHVKVTAQNSTISIFLDDMENPVRIYENADCRSNYFRAGVYNQSIRNSYGGTGIGEFSEIIVSDNF